MWPRRRSFATLRSTSCLDRVQIDRACDQLVGVSYIAATTYVNCSKLAHRLRMSLLSKFTIAGPTSPPLPKQGM
jgi:hypothetical protein